MKILYNAILSLAALVLLPLGLVLTLFSEKRRKTFFPRLGFQNFGALKEIKQRPIWIHALSVGEVRSSASLVKSLARAFPNHPIVFSASTATGRQTALEILEDSCAAILYFPYDLYPCVQRMVKAVNPALFVFVETDFWPNMLWSLKKHGVPVLWANARLSERSLKGYKRLNFVLKGVFGAISAFGLASALQKERFEELEIDSSRLVITGNTKFDQPKPKTDLALAQAVRKISAGRSIIVAGSTHPGEEEILLACSDELLQQGIEPLFVVAPRDIRRAEAVCALFSPLGAKLLSQLQKAGPETRALVTDALGKLNTLYSIADACFVGGSMVPQGGHNPIEPAALGKATVFGPHMDDFVEVADILVRERAAIQATDEKSLCRALALFVTVPEKAAQIGQRAMLVKEQNQGAVEKTVALAGKLLKSGN
ncbi:MAG: glycosyltransferase N-terminal domain-containing protein [Desulfatibacillaceae bacterium]|nr:glycosyltransferase N-terminal domain-containing protein [Desulfatibacillaceae bacterium]